MSGVGGNIGAAMYTLVNPPLKRLNRLHLKCDDAHTTSSKSEDIWELALYPGVHDTLSPVHKSAV
jgi:hypothetical protein